MQAAMTRVGATFGALLLSVSLAYAQDDKAGEWVPLFNGKNLDGWTPKIKGYEGRRQPRRHLPRRGRRAEGGVRQVHEFDGKFGHLFYKEKFSHYACGSSTGSSASSARAARGGRCATAA